MTGCTTLLLIRGGTEQWLSVILITVTAVVLWQWYGTYYEIKDGILHYHCGLLNGVIPINDIHNITIGKTQFWGLKVGSDMRGCIIRYNKNNGIYISPKYKDEFIAELLKINPTIKIHQHN